MKICLYSLLIASLFCCLNNILYKETPSLRIYCTVFLEVSGHCAAGGSAVKDSGIVAEGLSVLRFYYVSIGKLLSIYR